MKHTQQQSQWTIPFFSIWTGQAFSLIGSKVAQFALIWWLTRLTGSATVLATASLVALVRPVHDKPLQPAVVQGYNNVNDTYLSHWTADRSDHGKPQEGDVTTYD